MDIESGRPETDGNSLQNAQQADSGAVGTVQDVAEQWARGRRFSLAQMLLDASIIPADEVAKAQETAWKERQPLGHVLVRDGLVLSRDLANLSAPRVPETSLRRLRQHRRLGGQSIAGAYPRCWATSSGNRVLGAPFHLEQAQRIGWANPVNPSSFFGGSPGDLRPSISRASWRRRQRASGIGSERGC